MARPRPGDLRPPARAAKSTAKPASKQTIIVLGSILVILAFGCGFGALTVQADLSRPVAATGAPAQAFVVAQGQTFKDITVNLEHQHLIRSALVFQYYVKFKGLNPQISVQTYQISPSMTLSQILNAFVAQRIVTPPTATFSIPPGLRVTQYPAQITATLKDPNGAATTLPNFSADDFLKYARDGQTFDGESNYWFVTPWDTKKGAYAALEGYLYPATYQVYTTATTVDVIKTMLETFGAKLCPGPDSNPTAYILDQAQCKAHQRMIDYKSADFTQPDGTIPTITGAGPAIGIFDALTAKKLTLAQAVILGSIVMREARTPKNQALVGSVYYNRLKVPGTGNFNGTYGLLQADPVYQYYLGSQPGNTDPWAALKNPPPNNDYKNPYNPYSVAGLPPSAISNPSLLLLMIAAYPPNTTYYYFFYAKSNCDNHYETSYQQFLYEMNLYKVAGPGDC